ncbi:MAG: restriction endonuclease [Gemmatimonadales bacterium]
MDAVSYENLIEDICHQLTDATNATVHRRNYRGASGQEHQIDIAVEYELGRVAILFLIECKSWNSKVTLEEVLVLEGRLRDIGAHKGVIVTTVGFQEGAVRLARAKGIALVVCSPKREIVVIQKRDDGRVNSGAMDEVIQNIYEKR